MIKRDKYVDESWKEQAADQREGLAAPMGPQSTGSEGAEAPCCSQDHHKECGCAGHGEEDLQGIEVNFLNYVTSLGFQAMIFLGEIPNPVTNEVEKNLPQAKFLIDTLTMLKEKTKGNLDEQEATLLESYVYELQMKYVQVIQQKPA